MSRDRFAPFYLLLTLIIGIFLATSIAFSKSINDVRNCTTAHSDYIVDLIWTNGSFIAPLARLNINNSIVNIYGVFSLKNSNTTQLVVHVRNIKRLGNDLFIYADLVGEKLGVDVSYFVNGNLSIFVDRVNQSWISVELRLTGLSTDLQSLGQPVPDVISLLQHINRLGVRGLVPIWISNLSIKFLIDTRNGYAFLAYGDKLRFVGRTPLLPYNLTLSPATYSYIVVHNVLKELDELYSQPKLLEALVAPLRTTTNKTQQSRILSRLSLKLINGAIPSYGYLDTVCTLAPLVTGLGEDCNPATVTSYNIVLVKQVNYDAAYSLYTNAMRHNLEDLSRIISEIIQTRRFNLENITHGALVLLTFHGPLPNKPSEIAIFYAPVQIGNLRAVMLLTRGPSTGMESIKDYLKKAPVPVSSNAEIRLEKRIINGVPIEMIKVAQRNGPNITAYLWPRDLNGTDYVCTIYGKDIAPLFLRAQQAWSTKGNEPRKTLDKATNYVTKFLLVAASKGPRSNQLSGVLEGLSSLELRLLRESKEPTVLVHENSSSASHALLGSPTESSMRTSHSSTASVSATATAETSPAMGAVHHSFTRILAVGIAVVGLVLLGLYVFARRRG